ncbi:MAG TPA: hypothetical protein VGN16_25820 [Acidobacteriaceae bacterium]|jgi:hypothetical protein
MRIFKLVFGTIAFILALGLFWLVHRPLWLWNWQDFRNGNLAIQRVEAFRTEKGRLPDSLEELGANDLSEQIYYQKVDAQNYEVSFGIALGESEVYKSSTKRWE